MPTQAPGFMSMVPDVDCLFLAQPAANSDNSPMGFTLQRRIIKKRKNVDLDFFRSQSEDFTEKSLRGREI
jgi:hypothetical protein